MKGEILKDLLDDHNVILYCLFILALVYPTEAKTIVAGVLGYWAKSSKGEN
jgi:hypothetical protein